jgi:uncharacterized protein with NRDE domain
MCLFALFFRMVEDAPVVVGANREEFYSRGGSPPALLDGGRAVAGLDPLAGGTWLGVNAHGVVVAVTNRPKSQPPPQPRSRGQLARELLDCPSAAVAADVAAQDLSRGHYAGCNVVCADADAAVVLQAGDWLRVRPLPPGLHVVANRDVNDASDRRVAYALGWLAGRPYARADDCVAALKELCAQAGDGGPPMCLHGDDRGTVSGSIIAVRRPPPDWTYLHAQGSPDRTPYADCSPLLRRMRDTPS